MTATQFYIIAALAMAAAASILLFDRRGKTHKPAASIMAWIMFCQMGCLALAAIIHAGVLVEWFLIGGLAVHVLNIVLAKGNINSVRPHLALWFKRKKSPRQSPNIRTKQARHRHHQGNRHA